MSSPAAARTLAAIFAVAFISLASCKSKQPAPTSNQVATTAIDAAPAIDATTANAIRPFFFTAEKDGRTMHLLGTMHLGVDPDRLPASVLAALDAAGTLVVEADLLDPAVLTVGMRSDGSTLDQELGPELWGKFVAIVGDNMAGAVKSMTAMAAGSLLEASMLPQTRPMDMVLVGRAKNAKKEIAYLEAVADQVKVLGKWMDKRAIAHMVNNYDKMKEKAGVALAAYEAGDEKLMAVAMDKQDWIDGGRTEAEFDQFKTDLLYNRNAAWIPKLEALHAKTPATTLFVAVGAAHLLGPRSVMELLAQKGFTVRRM